AAKRMGYIAIVTGVVHRGAEEAVDKQCTTVFIDFVFHRLAVHGNFNNNVDVVRQILAGWDLIEAHNTCIAVKEKRNPLKGSRFYHTHKSTSSKTTSAPAANSSHNQISLWSLLG